MTSSADRVSSSLQMGDTTDDDKPCGQDVHQLEGILAKLLHSGDADTACVLFDPLGKDCSEFSSSGAPEIKIGSAQHSLLLLGNIALITRYLKTAVGNVLVHTTQDSLEVLFGKAFGCYLTSDLEEFFKVYRIISESLQNSISIMVENVDDVEKHTMLLVAEYLKDTEPDIKKIDQMKHELRKRVRSEMVTVADARAVAKFAFEVMETSVKKVSTDQKRIKVTLHDHQEQLHCQQQEIQDLKHRLEVQEEVHSRELKNQEQRHRQDMRDCKEDIMKELNLRTLQAEEREKEMAQHIQKLQNSTEEQATEMGELKTQLETLQTECDERGRQLREANEENSRSKERLRQARRAALVYKVVGGVCVVVVCTLAGGLIGPILGPVGGVIGAELGAAIGVGIAVGAVFGAGVCLTIEGGCWLLKRR